MGWVCVGLYGGERSDRRGAGLVSDLRRSISEEGGTIEFTGFSLS